ncbi:hypothetical protein HPP92_006024 [Vanilla planifolia]|uniref:NAC domain-containing protein n=1 Tax=Vanilla planifolia TaxID=51239 RepID=A0A835VDQ5_VANPL|nr:hypothetical protein HPP92_006024 [Vanilla planifolia]
MASLDPTSTAFMEENKDEIILPGFRFHPTDEELVGFYLRRKIQQKPLSIEVISQLDIYKYDPWDLPQLSTATDEKEWYFYCQRDRKYRNSSRPNRVTASGFWKATGTDRPIYSSQGAKCIGLKKSLVFYKGRAAKGIKTDWMMHEFRLPSLNDKEPSFSRRPLDNNISVVFHEQESWAICRIFKKTNTCAQRAISQSWISLLPEATGNDKGIDYSVGGQKNHNAVNLCPWSSSSSSTATLLEQSNLDDCKSSEIARTFMFSQSEKVEQDEISTFLNFSTAVLEEDDKYSQIINFGQHRQFHESTVTFPLATNGMLLGNEEECIRMAKKTPLVDSSIQLGNLMRGMNFPFDLTPTTCEEWKLNDLPCMDFCTPLQ